MSETETVKRQALHQIVLGKNNVVMPGKIFDCPVDQLEFLTEAGAVGEVAPVEDQEHVAPLTEAEQAEITRQQELEAAKAAGVKNLRKDASLETIREMVAKHNEEQDALKQI